MQWQRDVAVSLRKVGGELMEQHDLTGALAAYREALDVSRAVAVKDPGNTQSQRAVSVSLTFVGDVLVNQGDRIGRAGRLSREPRHYACHRRQGPGQHGMAARRRAKPAEGR